MVFNYVFREALRRAYDVLKAADNSGIKFQDFLLFMEEYHPEKGKFSVIWFSSQTEIYILRNGEPQLCLQFGKHLL